MLKYRRIHEIILLELMIGLINMIDIIKNVKISINEVLNINEKNLKFQLMIIIFFFIIFFIKLLEEKSSLELELILGLGIIGLNMIILSKDLIILYLAIELYSLSVYLLIYKNDRNKAQITILYFLLGSISSSFLLLGIAIIYNYTGILNIEILLENFDIITNYHTDNNYYLFLGLALFFLALLFKLGAAPFQYWVIRVYTQMDIKILIYQSIIPKFVYLFILLYFFSFFNTSSSFFLYLFLFSAFLSLFIAPIGANIHGVNQFKTVLAYSSILHVGFLLLGLTANISLYSQNKLLSVNLIEYLVIYGINTLHLFLGFLLLQFNKFHNLSLQKSLFFFSFLISLFSFIGLPPFAGFYAKLNIFINCFFTNNFIFFFSIFFILFSTLLSSFLYLKFIKFLYFSEFSNHLLNSTSSSSSFFSSYLFSFFSLFLFFYPFFFPFFSPFFDLFLPYL